MFTKLFRPDRGFDCAHIAYDCNDRTFENKNPDSKHSRVKNRVRQFGQLLFTRANHDNILIPFARVNSNSITVLVCFSFA